MENLTDDLLVGIFHRLPVETLGVCICSIIRSSAFVSSYSNITRNGKTSKHLIYWKERNRHLKERKQLYLHKDDNDSLDSYKQLIFPLNTFTYAPIVTCNGLICFASNHTNNIFLWNPIVRKVLTLPKSSSFVFNPQLGFAFDPLSNDYKILIIGSLGTISSRKVAVFSLKNNSWKSINTQLSSTYHYVSYFGSLLPVFNGALHYTCWLQMEGHNISNRILRFDVNAKIVREIEFPRMCDQDQKLELILYQESYLAVCRQKDYHQEELFLEVWVMKDYGNVDSWENIFKFDFSHTLPNGKQYFLFDEVLGSRKNGQVWIRLDAYPKDDIIFSIDCCNNTITMPELEGDIMSRMKPFAYFEESLLFLG